ncbi:hypothetical protein [Microterricola viridarii]|uniref:hypothetical protein n=1 Tax=Microterricola viridarii TaxID=412690 RepID=UPI0009E9AEB4|nr:hypothetical protein [Microterricola viridarii]
MPRTVRISGRSSSITNSFANGIIPVVTPTIEQIDEALRILGMEETAVCAYCGGPVSECAQLRPPAIAKQPIGYISETHNLVPACGNTNQSKGSTPWREWMFSSAPRSPETRGITGLGKTAKRLAEYEKRETPACIDFASVVGDQLRAQHWRTTLQAMVDAETTVKLVHSRVASSRTAE